MDALFGQIDCRSKSDAIVMRLLRSAMDNAHEKVQSMNGPVEFLHERSKFYELAAILVEGGLNIVEQEADIHDEISREKILSDLMEIKDWLQRRNEEMRLLIIEKDKELLERIENELKLRQKLELNETELVCLKEKEELQRSKSDGFQDKFHQDESKGSDIRALKNSVDQQVWNIKQKLEDEKKSLKNRMRKTISNVSDTELYAKISSLSVEDDHISWDDHFSGAKSLCRTLNPSKYNIMIRQMSSDIDILKGTFDIAFGRMENVELLPLEKRWRMIIERDTILVSIKGFIRDVQKIFYHRVPREKWTELIDDMLELSEELKGLCSRSKIQERRFKMRDIIEWDDELESRIQDAIRKLRDIIEWDDVLWGERGIGDDSDNLSTEDFKDDRDHTDAEASEFEEKLLLQHLDYTLREDFLLIYMQETMKLALNESMKCIQSQMETESLTSSEDDYEIEMSIREDIHKSLMVEMAKNEANFLTKESEILDPINRVSEDFSSVMDLEIHRDESFIKNLDSLLDDCEEDDDRTNEARVSPSKDRDEDAAATKEWLLTNYEKLETVLQEVHTSQALLMMLDREDDNSTQLTDGLAAVEDEIFDQSVLSPIIEFKQLFLDFEQTTLENLESKSFRIEKLKQEIGGLVQPLASMRERKLLYKKAFISRCHNLLLAENEVDLLGNQVEKLVCLLQRIYLILNQNSTALSHYFGVFDILNLIKREIAVGAAA